MGGVDVGALLVSLSALAFSMQAALIKLIDVPPILLLQCRGFVLWLLTLAAAWSGGRLLGVAADVPHRDLFIGDPSERGLLLLRATIYTGMILLSWTALECIPAGDATALSQPFLATNVLGACLLREPLRRVLVPCLLLHVAGCLLIARPHSLFGPLAERSPSDEMMRTEGVVAAVGSAVLGGGVAVLTRRCTRSHWIAIEHVNDAFVTFISAPLLLLAFFFAEPLHTTIRVGGYLEKLASTLRPDVRPLLFLGIPLTAFCGFALQIRGYQQTRSAGAAALMAPIEIPLATFWQALFFGRASIDGRSLAGMGLIVISVLINAWDLQSATPTGRGSGPDGAWDEADDVEAWEREAEEEDEAERRRWRLKEEARREQRRMVEEGELEAEFEADFGALESGAKDHEEADDAHDDHDPRAMERMPLMMASGDNRYRAGGRRRPVH